MDALLFLTKTFLIGVLIFGGISLIHIIKLAIFAFNMKKNEVISREDWESKSRRGMFYYVLFVVFSLLYQVLIRIR